MFIVITHIRIRTVHIYIYMVFTYIYIFTDIYLLFIGIYIYIYRYLPTIYRYIHIYICTCRYIYIYNLSSTLFISSYVPTFHRTPISWTSSRNRCKLSFAWRATTSICRSFRSWPVCWPTTCRVARAWWTVKGGEVCVEDVQKLMVLYGSFFLEMGQIYGQIHWRILMDLGLVGGVLEAK